MKYTTILCLLALLLSLAFVGCSRDPQPDPPADPLLPPAEDILPSSDPQPEESKEDEKQDQPQTENSSPSKENESAADASRRQPSRVRRRQRCSPTFPRSCKPALLPS